MDSKVSDHEKKKLNIRSRENSIGENKHNAHHDKDIKRESISGKENTCSIGNDSEARESVGALGSPRVPRKFISNWKHACDRTKDRTKELLKRWRTLPDSETLETDVEAHEGRGHGWSVHVWATWVKRASSEDEDSPPPSCLSQQQKEKFSHFFSHLLDWDRDDIISAQDFESLSERLRHFSDWSTNSVEVHILREVQQGFIETFITSVPPDPEAGRCLEGTATLDQWLAQWSTLLSKARNLNDFPLWLRYFAKIIFQVINKSGSGAISRDELRVYYSSFLGFDTQRVGETLDVAYNNMTSNGDHTLRFSVFNLCFANFLLGRNPHGPGQFLFGPYEGSTVYSAMFPIDYSALNTTPTRMEQYSPHKKSNRHSVIV